MGQGRSAILIIDDTPGNLILLGNALEAEFDLRVATSGAAGLRLAADTHPDLILLDVMMPDMDGFETCRRLKADPITQGIPVIFVTAVAEFDAEVTGLALGAADYITKPINVEIARQRIRNLIERERLRMLVESSALFAAEQLADMKRQFMANMSHELRTPLHAVLGLAGIGRRAKDLEKAHQVFERIQESGNQLLGLVEMVLDFTHAEAGEIVVEDQPFDLAAVLGELADEWGSRARAKGLSFEINGLAGGAWNCRGDRKWVTQVVAQLLSNAVKFTEQGLVKLAVVRETHTVRFVVADNGIGMTPEQIDVAFHPFLQADGSSTRRFGGIGLALALVRHLVELMGGTINAEAVPGAGTRFEVALPLPEDTTPVSTLLSP